MNNLKTRKQMIKLREELQVVEEEQMQGAHDYSIDEVGAMMRKAINDIAFEMNRE